MQRVLSILFALLFTYRRRAAPLGVLCFSHRPVLIGTEGAIAHGIQKKRS